MTVYAATAGTIRTSVIKKLRLDTTDDAAKVLEWLNQVSCQVAIESRYLSGSSAGSALAAAASSQALPATLVELEYIVCSYGGQTTLLAEKDYREILELRQGATASAGPPTVYALRKGTVELWPSAVGSEVLTYYGATLPDVLTADADIPPYPEPFNSKLLEYGALAQGAEYKNDPHLSDYQQLYQLWMNRFLAFLTRRQGRYPRSFATWTGGMGYIPHDPSTDLPGWWTWQQ